MLLLGPAARLAGYTSREGLVRAVRPDRGEELSLRVGGHPVPAPLAKRLSGFLEVRGLAGSRCSGLVSLPPHLHVSGDCGQHVC